MKKRLRVIVVIPFLLMENKLLTIISIKTEMFLRNKDV